MAAEEKPLIVTIPWQGTSSATIRTCNSILLDEIQVHADRIRTSPINICARYMGTVSDGILKLRYSLEFMKRK